MTQTFFYDPKDRKEDTLKIRGAEAHHIVKVLRLEKGEVIRATDGQGTSHICEIKTTASKSVNCNIIKTVRNGGEPEIDVAVAIGISTSTKFDVVVEKGTEVGVSRFIPLSTEKGKVKIREEGSLTQKMSRWRRVCEAAVKQSHRSVIPTISPPLLFSEFIPACIAKETVLFHPEGNGADFKKLITSTNEKRLTIVIGPESGFSQDEIELAKKHKIPIVGLGDRILRTETAGIVLPSMAIYLADLMK